MNHIKLFEELSIDREDFPNGGFELSTREKQILTDLVGRFLPNFKIITEDFYYYVYYNGFVNRFDYFNELRDYILFYYYITFRKPDDVLELIRVTKLDLSFDDNRLIKWASGNGYIEAVILLLKDSRVDPGVGDNYPIKISNANGHLDVTKLLLKDNRVDPSINGNILLKDACKNGNIEFVKLLLQDPRVDPSVDNNNPIRHAAQRLHLGVIKLLLRDDRVDPSVNGNAVIRYLYSKMVLSSNIKYKEIIKLLLRHPKVRAKISNKFKKDYPKLFE